MLLGADSRKTLVIGLSVLAIVSWISVPALAVAAELNSGFADQQPALSGNGRYLGFVSDRQGGRKLYVYDLQQQQFVDLPHLNRPHTVIESPSLSATGRYIVYLTPTQAYPEIDLYDRATQRSVALTPGYFGWVRNPVISPDGRYVVFESSREGRWDIEILDRGARVELDTPAEVLPSFPRPMIDARVLQEPARGEANTYHNCYFDVLTDGLCRTPVPALFF